MARGTIVGIQSAGGCVVLLVKNGSEVKRLLGDNGPTVRALHQAFGGVIAPGHRFNAKAVIGKEIEYEIDDLDLILWLRPLDN